MLRKARLEAPGVVHHHVPKDRLTADLHHGLGLDFGFFGQASSQTTGENANFHSEIRVCSDTSVEGSAKSTLSGRAPEQRKSAAANADKKTKSDLIRQSPLDSPDFQVYPSCRPARIREPCQPLPGRPDASSVLLPLRPLASEVQIR